MSMVKPRVTSFAPQFIVDDLERARSRTTRSSASRFVTLNLFDCHSLIQEADQFRNVCLLLCGHCVRLITPLRLSTLTPGERRAGATISTNACPAD